MKLQFLGVGAAFAQDNYQSNIILEKDGKRLLIDAGCDIRHSLKAAGLTIYDLDAIFISHLHTDACGGMEFFALKTYFDPTFANPDGSKRKPKLFLHESTKAGLWDMLKHGCVLRDKKAKLSYFFDVTTCSDSFDWEGVTFELVPTMHASSNGVRIPCHGLAWTTSDKKVWISMDTVFDTGFNDRFQSCDLIFHDCETSPFPTGVHAHYTELVTLPDEVRAKMWLFHYNDGDKPDAVAAGFAGWATQGAVTEV